MFAVRQTTINPIYNMKNLLLVLAALFGFVSCNSKTSSDALPQPEKDMVEVVYFHGKQRCPTCVAIEMNAKEVIDSLFADEVKDGLVAFRVVDISTPEGEAIADKYEVSWSSLFVNKWKDGKEVRNDMTEFSFANARNNPEVFKSELSKTIKFLMK